MSRTTTVTDADGREHRLNPDGSIVFPNAKRTQAEAIVATLDSIAREDSSEYGLPIYDDWHQERMINAVLDIIDPRMSQINGGDQ